MTGRRAVVALAVAALAAPSTAGTLSFTTVSPLGPAAFAARVLDPTGAAVAVVRPGEQVQLEPGRYRVELLTDPPIVRAAVSVPAEGEVKLRFELGGLRIDVTQPSGEAVATVADVFFKDGRRLATLAPGEALAVVPGSYQLVLRVSPNRTFSDVRVVPNQLRVIAAALGAALHFEARGVAGRQPDVHLRLRHPDGHDLVIGEGEVVALPPGPYDVVIDTVPPERRHVELAPERETRVAVDDLGLLRLDLRDAKGGLVETRAAVLDPRSGVILAEADNGAALDLRPGRYRVRFRTEPPFEIDGVVVLKRRAVRAGRADRPGRKR